MTAIMSDIRRWYYREVRSITDEAVKECLDRTDKSEDPREWLSRWIDQTCDGHEFVIYTEQAWIACAASSHDDAYEEQTGERPHDITVKAPQGRTRDASQKRRPWCTSRR